jgi:hypothetical protein
MILLYVKSMTIRKSSNVVATSQEAGKDNPYAVRLL